MATPYANIHTARKNRKKKISFIWKEMATERDLISDPLKSV